MPTLSLWFRPAVFTILVFVLVWGAAAADLLAPVGFSVLAYGGLILLSLHFREKEGIGGDLGHPLPGNVGVGVAIGAALMGLVLAVETGFGLAVVYGISPGWPLAVGVSVATQLVVAVGEELPFRGYLAAALAYRARVAVAIVASAALFSLAHLFTILVQGATPPQIALMLASIFLGGVILALLYLRSGLGAAMGFHFSWNLLQYGIFGLTGADAALVVRTSGGDLVTGGTLGPEAGLAGLGALALGATALLAWGGLKRAGRQAKA